MCSGELRNFKYVSAKSSPSPAFLTCLPFKVPKMMFEGMSGIAMAVARFGSAISTILQTAAERRKLQCIALVQERCFLDES